MLNWCTCMQKSVKRLFFMALVFWFINYFVLPACKGSLFMTALYSQSIWLYSSVSGGTSRVDERSR